MHKRLVKITGNIHSYTTFYAPENMSDKECIKNGYKELIDNLPKLKSGYISLLSNIVENDNAYVFEYAYVKILLNTKMTISKYKLIAKLMKAGLWTQVKQMLEDNNLLDLFNAAQVLDSEDEFFKQGLLMAKTKLGMTDEQIQLFLEEVSE